MIFRFVEQPAEDRKTKVFQVLHESDELVYGTIKWSPSIRSYAFFGSPTLGIAVSNMKNILTKLDLLVKEYNRK